MLVVHMDLAVAFAQPVLGSFNSGSIAAKLTYQVRRLRFVARLVLAVQLGLACSLRQKDSQ